MQPTAEQQTAIDNFTAGIPAIAVQAGAGTGKTSTIVEIARSTTSKGVYTAFNKSIVTDVEAKVPANIEARTTHSLAYRAVGHRSRSRLSAPRMRSDKIARLLDLRPFNVPGLDGKPKVIQPGFQGSLAMRAIANFCNSDDAAPGPRHVPFVEGVDAHGTYANNDAISKAIAAVLPTVWADLMAEDGRLPYKHDVYVKAWELGKPRIAADFILLDEAQDTAPVMASILRKQRGTQIVMVGDSAQAIYDWRGAVDAFSYLGADVTSYLTQSFRFGPAIANVANLILGNLGTDLRMKGLDSIASSIDIVDDPDAILTRTNGQAMKLVLEAQRQGRRPYLMGGGEAIASFARAVVDLENGKRPMHADLACFDSWAEVVDYTTNDPQGDELALMVKLVEDYGTDVILEAVGRMPRTEDGCDLVVSTAHKAKGREWDTVQLAGDFARKTDELGNVRPASEADLRLLYVAATRAKLVLDPYGSDLVVELLANQEATATA